jgi:hypothetical protein
VTDETVKVFGDHCQYIHCGCGLIGHAATAPLDELIAAAKKEG